MDLERIERALREGPVDEPTYVPGAYAPARPRTVLLFAGAIAGAMVLGVAIGLSLYALRLPAPGVGQPPVDLEALGEDLAGTWVSDALTRDEFVAFMTEAGHATADIEAYLVHDPIPNSVSWGLDFDGRERLVVFRTLTDGPTQILSNGPYELLPDGRLRWEDLGCVVVAEFTVGGDRLTFRSLSLDGCDADERIAHTTFFDLASPYTASPGP